MEMRRKEKMISQEEIMEVLEKAEYGVLSTVSGDGIPYGTPVNFVFMDGAIYFHCATEGHRLGNIAANDNVCFTALRYMTMGRLIRICRRPAVLHLHFSPGLPGTSLF